MHNAQAAIRYQLNKNKPERRKRALEAVLRYQAKNPEKTKAHRAVKRAILEGKLPKADKCSIEGCSVERVHAHHYKGYDKANWLDVIYLCPKHHKAAHALHVA